MKKSIPKVRERESEASILGNDREREFPLTPEGKYPYFSKIFDETRSDCPGHQKNDPDLQWRRTLKRERRNGRFSVGPKIAKRAQNPKKKVKFVFEISRKFLKN